MQTDINIFIDILQQLIDDLKNKPDQTEIVAILVYNSKNGIRTDTFKKVSDESKELFDTTLLEKLEELYSEQ